MLDPRTIMVAVPCYDGRVMSETAGSLISCQGLYAAVSFPTECSHVSLVRNLISGAFLASPYEWLVCIDSDIAFSRMDMQLLLEPCDWEADYFEASDPQDADPHEIHRRTPRIQGPFPRPSRVVAAQSVNALSLDSKTGAAADMLVCAEYPFKNDNLEPCKLGMGFVRIHRSVFERLQALKHDGGPTVEVQRDTLRRLEAAILPGAAFNPIALQELVQALIEGKEDKADQPRLWQTSHKGRLYHDYFPSGPILSQFVPTAEWKGEDHGFFTLCMLAGVVARIETRTRLTHIGRKAYQYLGPDMGGGQ